MKELSRTRNSTSIKVVKISSLQDSDTGAHSETNRIIFFNESLSRAVFIIMKKYESRLYSTAFASLVLGVHGSSSHSRRKSKPSRC